MEIDKETRSEAAARSPLDEPHRQFYEHVTERRDDGERRLQLKGRVMAAAELETEAEAEAAALTAAAAADIVVAAADVDTG